MFPRTAIKEPSGWQAGWKARVERPPAPELLAADIQILPAPVAVVVLVPEPAAAAAVLGYPPALSIDVKFHITDQMLVGQESH